METNNDLSPAIARALQSWVLDINTPTKVHAGRYPKGDIRLIADGVQVRLYDNIFEHANLPAPGDEDFEVRRIVPWAELAQGGTVMVDRAIAHTKEKYDIAVRNMKKAVDTYATRGA